MKKFLLATAICVGTAQAGLYTSITGLGMEQIQPDDRYTVNVVGEDVRVYEWTPRNSPYIKCISMFTESSKKSPNTQCFKKELKK